MLGNDQVGDCVIAAMLHYIMANGPLDITVSHTVYYVSFASWLGVDVVVDELLE